MIKHLILAVLLLQTFSLFSNILNVPQNYSSIQTAIDSASNGDTILVSPGLYYENLTVRGKSVFLTSNYMNTQDVNDVFNTIVDGSQYQFVDTACAIRIIGPASGNTVVQGMTFQGGEGSVYFVTAQGVIEGGGIYIQYSSPIIRWNLVKDNICDRSTGNVFSSGAGGLHTLNDTSLIYGNVFTNNQGLYGAGVVLNNSNATFTNNLLYNNRGGEDFGGGGMMVFCETPNFTAIVENNTIVSNISQGNGGNFAGRCGGVINFDCNNTQFRNNLVSSNYQRRGIELDNSGGAGIVYEYNVSPSSLGGNNADQRPEFFSSFLTADTSVVVDFGDPSSNYLDVENPNSPGNPLFPAQGTLRNDVGIYGGPLASQLPIPLEPVFFKNRSVFNLNNITVGDTVSTTFQIRNLGTDVLRIDSIRVMNSSMISTAMLNGFDINVGKFELLELEWIASSTFTDSILIYHNDSTEISPAGITVNMNTVSSLSLNTQNNVQIFPNPCRDQFQLNLVENAKAEIFDQYGQCLLVRELGKGLNTVLLDDLPKGQYYLRLNSKSGIVNRKIQVE